MAQAFAPRRPGLRSGVHRTLRGQPALPVPALRSWAGEGGRGPLVTLLSHSIHSGVIAVFQRRGLPDQELFSLNEGVR